MTGVVSHRLSLVLRFVDHFSGDAVPVELPVRVAQSLIRPVRRNGGKGARQADGSYRFRNLRDGTIRVQWREPFERGHAGWTRWDDDPEFSLPEANPGTIIDVQLWPTADAVAPAAATGVRGKLVGAAVDGLEVRIAPTGLTPTRFTRSDQSGEFLFLPPGALPTNTAGLVPLTIAVAAPGGAPRTVSGGSFMPTAAGMAFAGPDFIVAPQTVPRILFQLA